MANRTLASLVLAVTLLVAQGATAAAIIVTADQAPVMVGAKVVTLAPKGATFDILRQNDVWYGINVKVDGKEVFGWIHSRNVELKRAATTEADPLEAAAQKDLDKRKAQADKLAAEGKLDEAIALFDKFPQEYWRTKAGKKARQLGEEFDQRRHASPENLEASAAAELKKRKAQADKLLADGKVEEAFRTMDGFPGSYEKTKAYEEAKKYAAELGEKAQTAIAERTKKEQEAAAEKARKEHEVVAEFEKKVLEAVEAAKFDDAFAEVKALEDKKPAGKEAYLKFTRAFVELQKKAAEKPNAFASDNGLGDVYANDADFGKNFSRILNIRGPAGVTSFQGHKIEGGRIVAFEVKLPTPAEQVAAGQAMIFTYPWSPNVHYYLAKIYARAGETDKAVAEYAQARRLDRGATIVTLDSFIEAARTLTRAKRYPEAVGLLKQGLALKADDFVALTTLARTHLAAGAKAQAAAALEKSLKLNTNQPDAKRLLGEAKGQKVAETAPPKLPLPELVKQVEESCVVVTATNSSGSGYVVSAEGYVATNFHVIAPGGKLGVRTKRKGEFVSAPDVQLVLADPKSDIAILKCDPRVFPLKPLLLGSAKDAAAGEDIVVIGNPGVGGQILDYTITKGIISNADRVMNDLHYLQTDAAVNPGNSGGPLFNMSAQVDRKSVV